ncbi:MAG: cell division protein FtsH [Micavibrio sp.]|nr:cell division protein FtsH [Micavibrio sp.]
MADEDKGEKPSKFSPRKKKVLAGLAAAGTIAGVFAISSSQGEQQLSTGELSWSQFVDNAEEGKYSRFIIQGEEVTGILSAANEDSPDKTTKITKSRAPSGEVAYEDVNPYGDVHINEVKEPTNFFDLFFRIAIIGAIGFMIFSFIRNRKKAANGNNPFDNQISKSKAKLVEEHHDKKTFADVAGNEEAKFEMQQMVNLLKDPDLYSQFGGAIPKGALLVGPPGTGKTLMAKSVAGEAGVPFYTVSGSEFTEMFVGVGAARVRDMFEEVKKNAPCILFIDEIDALAKKRGSGASMGNSSESDQTLNQLLVEMDGFEKDTGVVILAATNRPDVLDPAIKRPGRLDRQIVVDAPDVNGRVNILRIHTRNKPIDPNINFRNIARGIPGMTGADIASMANEAALIAAERYKAAGGKQSQSNPNYITEIDFIEAKDKVSMGPARKSMVMSRPELENTAYHEACHAFMALHEPHADTLEKLTIVPRGMALGVAFFLPEEDGLRNTKAQFIAQLRVAVAGRIGEEILNGQYMVTPGASGDIQQATNIARKMVTEWGMSDKLGMVRYTGASGAGYLGHENGMATGSQTTLDLIDQEVKNLVDEAYAYSKKVLTDPKNLEQIKKLVDELLVRETIDGREAREMLDINILTDPYSASMTPSLIKDAPSI